MSEVGVNVEFFDTTLRDGAQALPPGHQFSASAKPDVAHQIGLLHGGIIEAGFPETPGDMEQVKEVAKTIGNTIYEVDVWRDGELVKTKCAQPVIAGLSRALPGDLGTAWEAVGPARYPRLHTFVSFDAKHIEAKFRSKNLEDVVAMAKQAVSYARDLTSGIPYATIEASAEAATTTDTRDLEYVVKTFIESGADVVNLPDTVGQKDPFWMMQFYAKAIKWAQETNPEVIISAHPHDDLGLATANSLALVHAAVRAAQIYQRQINIQVETTVCSLGERAGNADVFQVAAGLFKFSGDMEVPITWRFNPGQSVRVANIVMSMAGLEVGRQNPVVGEDINTIRSGVHSDAVIKGGYKLYNPLTPTFWGHAEDVLHQDGVYQGANGRAVAQQQLIRSK